MKNIIVVLIMLITVSGFAQLDELAYQITSNIDAYGPIYGEDKINSSRLVSLMYLPLLTISMEGDTEPVLLKGPLPAHGEILNDLSVKYSFELKPDIMWSNGEEITTDDVIFTFKVIKNEATLATNAKDKLRNVKDIEKTGRYSFDVFFNYESHDNLGAMFFKILPRSAFELDDIQNPEIHKSDEFFQEEPVTNGLYLADKAKGDYSVLEFNENYYDPEIVPNIKEIEVEQENEEALIVQEFLGNDDINFLPNMPIGSKVQIDAMNEYNVIQMLDYSWQFLAFNLRNPVLKDVNLRKAMTLAFDRIQANFGLFQGFAAEISGPFPPGHPSYNNNVDGKYSYDLELANELLQQNGYARLSVNANRQKDGKELKFRVVIDESRSEAKDLFNFLMNSFKEVGIELEADYIKSNDEYIKKVFEERDFDMAVVGYAFGTDPNPYTIFHSTTGKLKGGFNVCGLDNSHIDELLEEADSKKDKQTRYEMYKIIHSEIADLFPGIFLWRRPTFIAYDVRFEGLNRDTIDDLDIFKYIYKW